MKSGCRRKDKARGVDGDEENIDVCDGNEDD